LGRQSEFSRMYRRGKHCSGPSFVLYAARSRQAARIGVSVSKAVGKAVQRNLVRRRVQGVFDMLDPARYAEYDLLVVARPGAAELPFATLAAQLNALLRRVEGLVR